jgi:DNA adenine methylase
LSSLYSIEGIQNNELIANGNENSQRAAELFFYLNRTCFNGLCRFNAEGKFNVPFGKHITINYKMDLSVYKSIYSKWEFSNKSFQEIQLNDNDFVFADPPYDVEFRRYSKDGFEWHEQEHLARWLSLHKGPVVLCNHATDRIIALYKSLGYRIFFLKERINIKANGDRTPANVIIATKNIDDTIG